MAKPYLIINPQQQFFDSTGTTPNSGGKVFVYLPGTTTKQNTYPTAADAVAGTNANPNPVILDTSGRPANSGNTIDMYIGASYKMVNAPSTDTDPPSNAIWTRDNITTLAQTTTLTAKSSVYTVAASDRDAILTCDSSGGAFAVNLLTAASAGNGFHITIKKVTSSANAVNVTPNGTDTIDNVNAIVPLSSGFDSLSLWSDGTRWIKDSKVASSNLFYKEITAGQAALAAAGKVNIQLSSGTQQFKVRSILLSGGGTNFSGGGGDRLVKITDGTTNYTILTAAIVQALAFTRWGDTGAPAPVTGAAVTTATVAGANLYLQYSGGTVDYTAGSLTVIVGLEQIA